MAYKNKIKNYKSVIKYKWNVSMFIKIAKVKA